MADWPIFDASSQLGLFDTDVVPNHGEHIGYRGSIACTIAGISYRQLDYWARTELVMPTIQTAAGSGSQRLYSSATCWC